MPSADKRSSSKTSENASVEIVAGVLRSNSVLVALAVLLFVAQIINGQQNNPQQQTCPPASEISPCLCQVKKNGLDILCEATDYVHITRAMTALKPRSPIIFYLKLRHNSLPKLQGFIFLALDIRHLTIHNSSLAVIEETSLSSLGKGLTQLDVSQNQLQNVPSSALKNLHHLLILNLNHNKISIIHNRAFEGLDTLEILTLYENRITGIEPEAFRGLDKKLKRLNLGGNHLTSIPQRALSIFDTLKKLEVQENRIETIKEGDFEGLRNLDSLILAHNKLRQIPANVFSHLRQLNSLELEGNYITYVDKDAFSGLEENLQYLRLGDNNLHQIPSDSLRSLHRLRHLDLRSNNISYIPEDAFAGYGDSITFLNLQKNDIKTLPALAFENLNSLETLSIQNNKLTRIPEEVREPIIDTLRVVDIMDNPLICDCELIWFPNLLKELKNRDDEMTQKKRPMCTMASEHREYFVQNMPLERMNCIGKNLGRSAMSSDGRKIVSWEMTLITIFGTMSACLM
ncbi:CLUMA_CG019071, isoform A [Clunio marinus]|uniref:CLUMA_CG019071, isoform A n=1 Tax=Clunio marinus TaxID=568069 RepID=A0A1J1J072_9DIPT|nr:CLUMA_CG019071, isoform A [Clunio marinus]